MADSNGRIKVPAGPWKVIAFILLTLGKIAYLVLFAEMRGWVSPFLFVVQLSSPCKVRAQLQTSRMGDRKQISLRELRHAVINNWMDRCGTLGEGCPRSLCSEVLVHLDEARANNLGIDLNGTVCSSC